MPSEEKQKKENGGGGGRITSKEENKKGRCTGDQNNEHTSIHKRSQRSTPSKQRRQAKGEKAEKGQRAPPSRHRTRQRPLLHQQRPVQSARESENGKEKKKIRTWMDGWVWERWQRGGVKDGIAAAHRQTHERLHRQKHTRRGKKKNAFVPKPLVSDPPLRRRERTHRMTWYHCPDPC